MRPLYHFQSPRCLVIAAASLLALCSATSWSQQTQQRLSYTPSTAIDQDKSRAEQAAEQMVSLSADRIISILRDEPGLLLQVKKMLVRKAFEQGRILDPSDLTDDSLFRLVQEDAAIRVIATQQIEERSYVRAKPTREEIARNLPCQSLSLKNEAAAKQPDASSTDTKRIPTQEELYWLKHESDLDCYLTQYLPNGTAESLYEQPQTSQQRSQQSPPAQYPQQPFSQPQTPQQYPPSQNAPQQLPSNSRPQADMTQTEPPQGYFGTDTDQSEMANIQPDELPSLLNASQAGGGMSSFSKGGLNMGGAGAGTMGLGGSSPLGSSMGGGSFGSMLGDQGIGSGFPRESSTDNQRQVPLQPYYMPKRPQQPMLRHRPNPYADVPSLYDLYAQYSRRSVRLGRFGEDVFRNGTGNLQELPMDLPAGPDYIVGPGDGLTINLSGGISQRLQRVVDREGRVNLPEVGGVEISGRNLGDVQHLVQAALRGQFRGVEADGSLSRIRTVRMYVGGDVVCPGAYDVSSLSTPLNALYLAGGPTSGGSLRILRHYRGKSLVEEVDTYDLLLHGIRGDMQRLQAGDTLEVPPLEGEVTVAGMVRRPAIYELHGEKTLAEVLDLAGGVLPTGTLRHVDVERVERHKRS